MGTAAGDSAHEHPKDPRIETADSGPKDVGLVNDMYRYVPRVVARWLLWVRGTCLVLESPVTIPCSISGWVFTVRFAAPVYYLVYLQFSCCL